MNGVQGEMMPSGGGMMKNISGEAPEMLFSIDETHEVRSHVAVQMVERSNGLHRASAANETRRSGPKHSVFL